MARKRASRKKPELMAKDEDDDTAAITTQKGTPFNRKTCTEMGGREAPVHPQDQKGVIELLRHFFHCAGRLINLLLFPVRFVHYSNRSLESHGDPNTRKRTEELDQYCGDLPDDVCELILHKVTVDNLWEVMKLKQVCRSWREAVSSHAHFISHSFPPLPRTVSNASGTSTLGIVLSQKRSGRGCPIRFFHVYLEQDGNGAIRRQITEICNIRSSSSSRHFGGYHASQAGMVLLTEWCNRGYNSIIVQPFTGEYMHLPATSPPPRNSKRNSNKKMFIGYGFIYDVAGNCYKVARLFFESYRAGNGNELLYRASNCQMLTLGKDDEAPAWRSIVMDQFGFCIGHGSIWAVAVNQMHLVWMLQNPANRAKIVLLTLDAHKETLREKPHPACWDERRTHGMNLDVLGDCLSMTDRTDWMEGEGFFHVWVLKDYDDDTSWALTYSICIDPMCVVPFKIIAVWGGRLVLCYRDGSQSLLLYDPETTEYRSLGVMQWGNNVGAVEYKECTVSLKYVAKGGVVQRSSGTVRVQRGPRTQLQQVGKTIQPDECSSIDRLYV